MVETRVHETRRHQHARYVSLLAARLWDSADARSRCLAHVCVDGKIPFAMQSMHARTPMLMYAPCIHARSHHWSHVTDLRGFAVARCNIGTWRSFAARHTESWLLACVVTCTHAVHDPVALVYHDHARWETAHPPSVRLAKVPMSS